MKTTVMKPCCRFLIFFLSTLLLGCAGGRSLNHKPEAVIDGMKETHKGIEEYNKGCYKRSLEHFLKAHELFAASDHLSGAAMSMNNIGNIYRITGDNSTALLFYEEAFDIYTDLKDDNGAMQALSNNAAALIDKDKLKEAEKVLEMGARIAKKNRKIFIPILSNRGILLTRKKEYQHAEKVLRTALANTDRKKASEFATVNFALGNLMLETKQYKKAEDFLATALETDRAAGFHKGIADDLAAMGSAHFSQGEYGPAVNFFKRSIKIYALLVNTVKVQNIMGRLDIAAEKADLNITITKHFVKKWMAGEMLECPCE